MRKLGIIITFVSTFFSSLSLSAHQEIHNTKEFNRLNWVEVTQTDFSSQIMFDFVDPVYFQKNLINGQAKIELSFTGMQLSSFNPDHVTAQISKLKSNGFLEHVEVRGQDNPIAVVLSLTFAQQRTVTTKNAKQVVKKSIPNKLLIKWSKIDNRLILDIFPKEALEIMQKKENPVILEARNDLISDINPVSLFTQKKTIALNKPKKKLRIVLDPGHGGIDEGAICPHNPNLKEKDIALSIAKKTRAQLQKAGHNVLLTRNNDSSLTLAERSEFAHQLKADLFVSIHVNAKPTSTQPAPNARDPSGIDTYYLYAQDLLSPTSQRGFLFINQPRKKKYISLVDNMLEKSAHSSKQLATSIQANLINFLRRKKITVLDRGIKKSLLRVLLRSAVPSALVEVGFITNRAESQRLASNEYQNFIAHGISTGIQNYLNQIN